MRKKVRCVDYLPGVCSGIDEFLAWLATDAAAAGGTDAAVAAGTDLAATGAAAAGTDAAIAGGTALAGAGADAALTSGAIAGVPAAGTAAEGATLLSTAAPIAGGSVLPALGAGAAGVGLGALSQGGGAAAPAAAPAAVSAPAASPDVTGTPFETSQAPPLFAGTGNPLQYTGGVAPDAAMGTEDIGGPAQDVIGTDAADSSSPSFWDSMLKELKTPKGALGAGLLASNLYGLLNRPSLPGAAKTALGAAGPAVAQAQSVIQTGGMGSPIWTAQKSAIDAQIDQQIQNMTAAIQQSAANSGMGGSNSGIVQEQIASMTAQLNTERVKLYDQALQQNVNNAIAELTGANQTLMSVANLQLQEDQYAQQLARDIGLTSGELFSLWPSATHG